MVIKQREMDGIVRQIYTSIESEDHLRSTLFVVCGDHGMNDAGNHGASSPGETSPALVFMSPKLKALKTKLESPLPETESFQYYSTVEQSDLAPTLAALLGFPVPKNNLGALIPDFLPFWPNSRIHDSRRGGSLLTLLRTRPGSTPDAQRAPDSGHRPRGVWAADSGTRQQRCQRV
jgi:ethanolaminephosphotransferase